MVSAWGSEQRLVLGQLATDAESNEITTVPKLLDMLTLKGRVVTLDELNCRRTIAEKIVERGADHVLALKGNQGTLHRDVKLFLDDPATPVVRDTLTVRVRSSSPSNSMRPPGPIGAWRPGNIGFSTSS